jgi:hypothetical protein
MFNLSPEDAHQLARHVSPDLTEHDLAHLDAYQAAVRLVVDGREQPAFTLRTLPAPDPIAGRAAEARRTCRALFAGQAPPRRLTTRPDLPPPASTGRRQGDGSEGGPAGRSGDGSGGRPSSAPPSGRKPAGQKAGEGADRNPDSPGFSGGEAR